jgi:hypothetical protein
MKLSKIFRVRHYRQFSPSYGISIVYKAIPKVPKRSIAYMELISGLAIRRIKLDQFSRKEGRETALKHFKEAPVTIINYPGEDLKESIFRFLKNEAYNKAMMMVYSKSRPKTKPSKGDIPPRLLMEIAEICLANKEKKQ